MGELKLLYWDIDGGRGEVARLALSIGGIAFEDQRVAFRDWGAIKAETPFGAIPVLTVDGTTVAQCNGINRYVGKLTGLYPDDALQAAFCDEAMDAVEDVAVAITTTFSIEDEDEKKTARTKLAGGTLTSYLTYLQQRLEARGGEYFADNRLTVADLKVFLWVRMLKSGILEYISSELPDDVAPKLVEHYEHVRDYDGVKAYYDARSKKR